MSCIPKNKKKTTDNFLKHCGNDKNKKKNVFSCPKKS